MLRTIIIGGLVCILAGVLIAGDTREEIMHRRDFIRRLGESGDAVAVLREGLRDADPLIRRKSLYELYHAKGAAMFPEFKGLNNENDPEVMKVLEAILRDCPDREAVRKARPLVIDAITRYREKNQEVDTSDFPFKRRNIRLQDRPDWDFDVVKIGGFRIADENWRFKADPERTGHTLKWYEAAFDDSQWIVAPRGDWTLQAAYKNYSGIGWYRVTFDAPVRPRDTHAAELHFLGLDDSAWVFLNGKYVGSYLMGRRNNFLPFWLDITDEITWNGKNTLVVRVSGSRGGLTKPVEVDFLK